MENKIQLLKPRRFGDVINDTLAVAKQTCIPMLQVILFTALPLIIFGAYFYTRYFSDIFRMVGNTDPGAMRTQMAGMGLNALLGVVGLMLASLLLYLTVIETFLKYEASETGVITTGDILDGIKKDFFSFLGFMLAFTVLFFIAFFVMIGIIVGVVAMGSKGLAVLLGFALFFGLFYVMIVVAITPFIYMRERDGIIQAISRAFYLIKGHWWQTFGIFFVSYMIVYIASLIFIIPFYAMFFTKLMHGIQNGGTPSFEMDGLGSVAMIFMFCGMMVLSSLIHMAFTVQYYSLVERKDGVDVMLQIENLGTATPEA